MWEKPPPSGPGLGQSRDLRFPFLPSGGPHSPPLGLAWDCQGCVCVCMCVSGVEVSNFYLH